MFSLVQECKKDNCFKCGKKITDIAEFSIEHKIPWLGNNSSLFWDLNNIAFSHLSCNKTDRPGFRSVWRKAPKGKSWCYICKTYKNIKKFAGRKVTYAQRNPYQPTCYDCKKLRGWD